MKPIFHLADSVAKNFCSQGRSGILFWLLFAMVSCGLLALPSEVRAQAQAANGVIEGTVTDASGAVDANAKVKIVNLDTGLEREVTNKYTWLYRAPLLTVAQLI